MAEHNTAAVSSETWVMEACPQVKPDDLLLYFLLPTVFSGILIFVLQTKKRGWWSSSSSYSSSSSSSKKKRKSKAGGATNEEQQKQKQHIENGETKQEEGDRYQLGVVDHILGIVMLCVVFLTIYPRVIRGVPHWLAQPCHSLSALLVLVIYYTRNDSLFWFYYYSYWQSYPAFVAGDMSWYIYEYEVWHYWIQHLLLVIIPLYYFIVGRFSTSRNSFSTFLSVYAFDIVYHSAFLIPVGYFTRTDFDNMICPHPGLAFAGAWWREVMALASFPVAFILCFLPPMVIGAARRMLLGKRANVSIMVGKEKEAKKTK